MYLVDNSMTTDRDASWALEPFPRVSATDHVLSELRQAIIDGELPPGTQLHEARIAELVQTGRGAVREAVRQLVQEGLAEHLMHRGVFVRVMSPVDRLDVYTARRIIESGVVRQLVTGESMPDLSRLRAACDAIAAAATSDGRPSEGLIESDIAFHQELVALVGSPRLSRAFETLAAETLILLRHHPPYPGLDYASDHREILEAVAGRNPRAPDLIEEHLRVSVELIGGQLRRESDPSP